jgi:hypothetical protein
MAKYAWTAGSTSRTIAVKLNDSSSSVGAGLPGIVAANLDMRQIRIETDNDVTESALTLSDLTTITDSYTSGGWKEINATHSPGLYRLDIPDGLIAAGAWTALITIIDAGSNNIAPQDIEIQLDPAPVVVSSITAGAITTASFTAGAINAAAIGADAITAAKIADGAIDAATLASGTITAAKFAASAIDATAIASNAITSAKIATGAITATTLAAGTITTATFAAGAINVTAIANDAITDAKVAADVTIASVGALGTQAKADVNAEALDVLFTDTHAEPGQGTPPSTLSTGQKIDYLYKAWLNLKVQNASVFNLYNAAGTVVDQKSSVTNDGIATTRTQVVSGP